MRPAKFISVVTFAAVEFVSVLIKDGFIEPHLVFCFVHSIPALLAALCLPSGSFMFLDSVIYVNNARKLSSLPFSDRS